MRKLTLDEKISIKGRLARKGFFQLPRLDMKAAVHYWYMVYGCAISQWHRIPIKPIR